MNMKLDNTALLIIDVQKGFDNPFWGNRNNPQAELNITLLLNKWREQASPIIHIQHCSTSVNSPLHPENPGNDFKDEVLPLEHEVVFTKTVNSAFIGTKLQEHLEGNGIQSLVIVGLTTDHCVSTTTRMAGNLGFEVFLVSDATATFDREGHDGKNCTAEEIHNIHLTSLHGEFCKVISAKEILNSF
jgi:nicotinamidase-related amidase